MKPQKDKRKVADILPQIIEEYGWKNGFEKSDKSTSQCEGARLLRRKLRVLKTRERNLLDNIHFFVFDSCVFGVKIEDVTVTYLCRKFSEDIPVIRANQYDSRARAEKAFMRRLRMCRIELAVAEGNGEFTAYLGKIEEYVERTSKRYDTSGPLSNEELDGLLDDFENLICATANRYQIAVPRFDRRDIETELRIILCKVMQSYNPSLGKPSTVLTRAFRNRLISMFRGTTCTTRFTGTYDWSMDYEIGSDGESCTLHDIVGTIDTNFGEIDNRLGLQKWLQIAPERVLAAYENAERIIAEMWR